uniref:(northern house mosquito) hypothetical protein n=1 Tax=Culex pipiens TaxID=7175 RepID=A0A8D8JXS8_CULPI
MYGSSMKCSRIRMSDRRKNQLNRAFTSGRSCWVRMMQTIWGSQQAKKLMLRKVISLAKRISSVVGSPTMRKMDESAKLADFCDELRIIDRSSIGVGWIERNWRRILWWDRYSTFRTLRLQITMPVHRMMR